MITPTSRSMIEGWGERAGFLLKSGAAMYYGGNVTCDEVTVMGSVRKLGIVIFLHKRVAKRRRRKRFCLSFAREARVGE